MERIMRPAALRRVGVLVLAGLVATMWVVGAPAAPVAADEAPPVFDLKWGTFGTGNGQLRNPTGVAVDSSGNVYVADYNNDRIQKFTSTGTLLTSWGILGVNPGQFYGPATVAVDSSGNVYVADGGNNRIQKFTSTGTFVTQWGTIGTGDGQFQTPSGVDVDSSGNVYVADYDNHRIQRFTSTGTFVTKWGTNGGGDGQFRSPRGVEVDSSGNVYVADADNHRIQRFRPADAVDPTVDLRAPAAGAVFEVGEAATADFSCDDAGGSGLDTCIGTVANGAAIDTVTVGERTFTVTATDHDGNETVVTHTYRVRPVDPVPGLSGTVTSSGSGSAVGGAWVAVLRASDFSIEAGAVADGSGNFAAAVPPGSYYLYVVDPSAAHTAGFHGAPTTVTVTATATAHADPQMAPTRGAVAGTVTEAGSGAPVGGAWVIGINAATGAIQGGAVADGAGQYRVGGLRAGSYRPVFVDPTGAHGSRYFPNSVDFLGATSLAVTAGGSTAANVALPAQSTTPGAQTLSGTVREAGSDTPLGGVFVVALRASDFANAGGAVTDASGQYSFNVAAGDYKLAFVDSTGGHNMEWHDNQPNTGLAAATSVTAPAVTDAALDATTGTLTGGVLNDPADDPAEGPVPGAWVVAIDPTGAIAGGAVTRNDGIYEITGLAPGTYRATIVDPNGGRTQEYFDNAADYAGATPFNVTAGATTPLGANLVMAPLTNDNFADAEDITGATGGASGSTVRATKEPGEPDHASNAGGGSIWYRWTAPANGRAHFATCGSDFDTTLAAYTGTEVNNLPAGWQNDNAEPNRCGDDQSAQSWAWFPATAGVTYHIAVDGHDNARGHVILSWLLERAPNDDFVDAPVLTGASGTASGSTRLASKEPGEPDHAFKLGEASIWYRWTAPSNGTVTFTTCGSTFDTLLAAYTGPAVHDLTYVSSNDDGTCPAHIQRSVMPFAATAGVTYHIAVDGYRDARGDVTLNWSMT